MKNKITITWNPHRGEETKVDYNQYFEALTRLEQADCLSDAIGILQDRYDKLKASGILK